MTDTSITSQLIPTISTERGLCELRLTWMSGILSAVYLLLFLFSVLSNVFVIITILGKRHLAQRSITNYYLLNLAIADLLRSLVCIPSTMVSELFQCWILGPLMCKLSAFLQPVGVCASAYTLAVIAVERYYAICEPLNSRNWNTKTRAVILLIGVWGFSFVTNVASLLLFEHKLLPSHWSCGSEFPASTMFFYQLYITLVLLFIPLCLMIYLYGNVIYTLNSAIENNEFDTKLIEKLPNDRTASITDWFFTAVKQSRFSETFESLRSGKCSTRSSFMLPSPSTPMPAFPEQLPSPSNVFLRTSNQIEDAQSSSRRGTYDFTRSPSLRRSNQERILIAKRKVTRMLITIVVLFALCWTPNYIWWLVVRFGDAMGLTIWDSKLNTVLTLLTYISSCTNPLTYCFMNKSFRRALLSYFKRNKRTKVQKRSPAQFNRNSSPAILGTPKAQVQNVPKIRIDLVSTTQ